MTPNEQEPTEYVGDWDDDTKLLLKSVDKFAAAMKRKLVVQAGKGWHGWGESEFHQTVDDEMFGSTCHQRFQDHAAKLFSGDPAQAVDIANFCMFIAFYHGEI